MGRGLGTFPILAGQRPTYLYASLLAFARGERHSGTMKPVAAGLSDRDMREMALYYANLLHRSSPTARADVAAAIERGREIAMRGIPSERVLACAACHGPGSRREIPSIPISPDNTRSISPCSSRCSKKASAAACLTLTYERRCLSANVGKDSRHDALL
jgi:cytochrome c553